MQTEKQQPQQHEEAFLLRHAAREQSLSLLKRRSEEFISFYSRRELAIKGADRGDVLEAERVLDQARVELLSAVAAELQRVARVNELHGEKHQEELEQPSGEPDEVAHPPLTGAERMRRLRERKKGARA